MRQPRTTRPPANGQVPARRPVTAEVTEAEVEKILPVVKKVMEEAPMPAVSLHVPLHVDARGAGNWDEAH
jgi:DNA polymerase I-like protein with 3'-5' exonuclease and polymerase domains